MALAVVLVLIKPFNKNSLIFQENSFYLAEAR